MRKQIREIRVRDLYLYLGAPPVVITAVWLVSTLWLFPIESVPNWCIYLCAWILTYYQIKRFFIGTILLYKAFAPMKMRDACRFHPTCSTYMIMAVNKYGLIIGFIKGVHRLFRCHPPNGGEDYP